VLWLAVGTLLWYRLIGWPPGTLPRLPMSLPSLAELDVWLRSPLSSDWTGFVATIGLVGWAFWAWAWASLLLEAAVNLADAITHHAAWVIAIRAALRPLTVPFIRRIVDASLGGLLLARVALQPMAADAAVPWRAETAIVPSSGFHGAALRGAGDAKKEATYTGEIRSFQASDTQPSAQTVPHEVLYHVQRGDSLWTIAQRLYGDGEKESLLFDANVGLVQPDGRALTRHGVIYPDWVLRVPEPIRGVDTDAGEWWYTVQPGDTLSGIGARLLGDPERWPEIYQLNRGAQAPDGHVLHDPNLIWPELRLRLPVEGDSPQPETATPAEPEPPPSPTLAPVVADQSDRQQRVTIEETPTRAPTTSVTPAPTPAPVRAVASAPVVTSIQAVPTSQPAAQLRSESNHPVPPAVGALAAAGLAAAALAAGGLVVYKRKPGRHPDGPESDVRIQDGFADVDPGDDLARRLARRSDPASAIARLLGQAYAAIFDEMLQPEERQEVRGITVAATRHGRTSTTLVLAAPLAARAFLVHHMRAATERAFGEQVDVDGKVDQDGDVLVRVTWDPRHPIPDQLLQRGNDTNVSSAWSSPCLVPALVLHDRQHLAINWHTLGNVVIAAPTGQGADQPMAALAAALASVRAPEDLGLVVVARPHTLPDEIGRFPHVLVDAVDPGDPEAVQHAIEDVRLEIDRRRQSGSTGEADLVLLVRELGDLEPDALETVAGIAATGPEHSVRILAASERSVPDLLRTCPFIDRLGTRLVLQTATEEDSVALLGVPGAERIGAGGFALLRLEGRIPFHGSAHRVPADRLARLVQGMQTRAPAVSDAAADEPSAATSDEPVDSEQPVEIHLNGVADLTVEKVSPQEQLGVLPLPPVQNGDVRHQHNPSWASPLLRELSAAPIRVRCFGACEVRHGDRLLKIGDPELLLLLAVYPITGINGEAVGDMLWDEIPADLAGNLRRERSKLRLNLRELVPDLRDDPLPGNAKKGEKVVILDTSVVSSDVHEFTELLDLAKKLPPADAIEAYEAALALYRGDLLDAPDMRHYRWMYNVDPQIGVMRRSDFESMHKEARLKLASLLAEGPEAGLARAEELYSGLCAEDFDDEHLWTALFRIHERTGSTLGLESTVRRLRDAQIELGTTDGSEGDEIPLPPNLERLVQRIRQHIGQNGVDPASGGAS
jgi:nucleoid-associated protein YgaU